MTAPRPIALVTGASRGLGLETSRKLLTHGFDVVLTSRAPLDGEGARVVAEAAPAATHLLLDVTSPRSIASLSRSLEQGGTALTLAVLNAGIALDGFDAAVAARTLDTNALGALAVADALAPRVARGGQILLVSSGMGELSCLAPPLRAALASEELTREALLGYARSFVEDVAARRHAAAGWPSSAYRVSKVLANAAVRLLARELAPKGVRVNAVCPGWVQTDMGGPAADRTVAEGARSIVASAIARTPATGTFFRDGAPIEW